MFFCDNRRVIGNSKEPRSHKRSKHIERKYHIIREYVARGDVKVMKIVTEDNLTDPFASGSLLGCYALIKTQILCNLILLSIKE